jgi:hypothetical protein
MNIQSVALDSEVSGRNAGRLYWRRNTFATDESQLLLNERIAKIKNRIEMYLQQRLHFGY